MCVWLNQSGDCARISIVGQDGMVSGYQVSQLLHGAAHGTDILRRSM